MKVYFVNFIKSIKHCCFFYFLIVFLGIPLSVESKIYSEGFENGWNGWYADKAIWQVGKPSKERPDTAYKGLNCAGTVLDGKYPSNSKSSLISPKIILPRVQHKKVAPSINHWKFF